MRTVLIAFLAFFASVPGLARAAENLYTVKDVPVDATAAASVEAQTIAINNGRPKAWTILYHRLTRQEDWSRQPQLDDANLQHLIKTYTVSDEKRSTKRYVAKVTYVFSAPAVSRLLRNSGIAYVDNKSRRVLLVPLSPGYAPNAPWTIVWRDPRFANGIVPIIAPSTDPADEAALSGVSFENAGLDELSPLASRLRASDVVLAQLVPAASGHVQVNLRRLSTGQPLPPSLDIPVPQGQLAAALPAVADAVAAAITDVWKDKAAVDYSHSTSVTVDTNFSSVAEWANLQKRLASIDKIVGVDTIGFTAKAARLNIAYVGTIDQLRDTLTSDGLAMQLRNGQWWIGPAAPQAE